MTTDRGDLYAGPMRWTCIEPLEHWKLELGPNPSGIEYELHYHSRAPLWELLPITIRKRGRTIVDMTHIKQPGRYTGWISIDGERIPVDGFPGGRDRTFGVRAAEHVDFWLWFEAGFDDRAIEAWVWESRGRSRAVRRRRHHVRGRHALEALRALRARRDLRRRPQAPGAGVEVAFVDEDGVRYDVVATSPSPHVGVYYGNPAGRATYADGVLCHVWDSTDAETLADVEEAVISLDQLMRFEMDGMVGHGIFELLVQGNRYARYPQW